MFENRNFKADLAAVALLAASLFLALALASYDPADPLPAQSLIGWDLPVYPVNAEPANLCGSSGATVAHGLLSTLGVGTYLLLGTLIVLTARLLRRQTVDQPVLRTTGWVLTLISLATLAAMTIPALSQGPVIGSGGYLGAMTWTMLDHHFATAGGYLVIASLLVAGLLLWTDELVFRAVWRIALRPAMRTAFGWAPQWRRAAVDEEELEAEADDAPQLRVAEIDEDAADEEPEAADEVPRTLRIKTPPSRDERQAVIEELEAAASTEDENVGDYELPSVELLLEGEEICYEQHKKDIHQKARLLERTFKNFGFNVQVVDIETGPVITQYEIELEAGLRLSKITSLSDDIAIALRVPSVRIVAPIPGKNTVGIEVPNAERQLVRMREVMEEGVAKAKGMQIPIYLGKDVSGNPLVCDLTKMPHLLIAGRTGTGKSVCLNSIIVSILMARRPDEVKLLLIDPKMVELSPYKKVPHLMHPVVTDMKKAEAILAWAVDKMEERYALLARAGVRHMSVYNELSEEELRRRLQPETEEEWSQIPKHLPYIVIVADEMADLMMTAAKEVEGHIIRLAQKSRAVGIHLVLATQKPTVDVVTGLIKSNLPARIAFQVASRTDSRVVLDEMGADKLLGNGDMLFLWPGTSMLLRGQGTFISDDEINSVIDCIGTNEPQYVHELVTLKPKDEQEGTGAIDRRRDDLYEAAIDVVIREGRGSVSLLQRALGIGYGRGARLIDYMAEDGIVGDYNGSQAREVLMTLEQWESRFPGQDGDASPAAAAKPAAPAKPAVVADVEFEEVTDDEEEEEYYEQDELEEEDEDYDDGEFDEDSEYEEEEDEYEEEPAEVKAGSRRW